MHSRHNKPKPLFSSVYIHSCAPQVMDSDAEGCASDAFNYFKVRAHGRQRPNVVACQASEALALLQVLCIQGFLAARKHAEQILLLAEMMQVTKLTSAAQVTLTCTDVCACTPTQGWNVPCFRGGAKVLQQLRKRFHLGSTEEQCVELVLTLIGDR